MTEKFDYDWKDHTDKHERWNLTENVLQRWTLTGEYDWNLKISKNHLDDQPLSVNMAKISLIRSYSTVQVCRPNEFKPL